MEAQKAPSKPKEIVEGIKSSEQVILSDRDKKNNQVKRGDTKITQNTKKQDELDVSKESSIFVKEVVEDTSTNFIVNNPGNFKRVKAVTVDLSEFEQMRL